MLIERAGVNAGVLGLRQRHHHSFTGHSSHFRVSSCSLSTTSVRATQHMRVRVRDWSKCCIGVWAGRLAEGDETHHTTLLLRHGNSPSPERLRPAFARRVVSRRGGAAAARVPHHDIHFAACAAALRLAFRAPLTAAPIAQRPAGAAAAGAA
eukprot:CAMPEP_0119527010 /NCGR_PEP_ID=MMETSP1344-20130328/41528_1 /TAXON_ID=236787 /ORGANISM="Florenciella parvula, Strain CCMP2471" /LENGTH=151 /DNA_ID=CAMNT_0007566141 /DNA_START=280 /DNA_END=733 /DNA_ORIENTATION=+